MPSRKYNSKVLSTFVYISTYINTKMYVCLFVCLFRVFPAILKPIGKSFGTNLPIAPGSVLKQYYFKKCYFLQLLPFFLFLYDFSVNLKSDYRKKTKGGRNLILFAKKLTGHTEKFTGIFFQTWPVFFVFLLCLFVLNRGL